MSNDSKLENNDGHAFKCGGIPMLPDKSLYEEMRAKLDDEELEHYKRNVEKYYGDLEINFPWDDE